MKILSMVIAMSLFTSVAAADTLEYDCKYFLPDGTALDFHYTAHEGVLGPVQVLYTDGTDTYKYGLHYTPNSPVRKIQAYIIKNEKPIAKTGQTELHSHIWLMAALPTDLQKLLDGVCTLNL